MQEEWVIGDIARAATQRKEEQDTQRERKARDMAIDQKQGSGEHQEQPEQALCPDDFRQRATKRRSNANSCAERRTKETVGSREACRFWVRKNMLRTLIAPSVGATNMAAISSVIKTRLAQKKRNPSRNSPPYDRVGRRGC